MKNPLIMTPGPTYIHEEVRMAMARPITNPDLDASFFEFYQETCSRLKEIIQTKNDVFILSGEGILGLEAACASLIEPGDRVLCIDNGIFGNGFGDFVKMYGGEAVYFKSDYRRAVDVALLEAFLKKDHDFRIATLVHCETPSGITNPIEGICKLLNQYGIISVVDSVSAVGGEVLKADEWAVDMILGGSQKCLSAPPGLTFLSVSPKAWEKILNRKMPIIGYYANLSHWRNWYQEKWFPYTQPISDIYALRSAVERWLMDENPIERHKKIAEAVRKSLLDGGLDLYAADGFSNTVTTVNIPENISFQALYQTMLEEHNILIAGAFGFLKDKVIRIGHMGENCHEDKVYLTLKALDQVLRKHGIQPKVELHKAFISYM
ncbi:pyridoxal-phosphate-dependent aminotransferase family protein [Geosporobacter ferrireducens]|uniref:Serine-pyruvate aminotransferase/archaeal aspartate aminotransferase n=1 Tax=Geosporobacter ferrireducens TaxID=1424294 RepID=A0A1D8GL76_9FIRM|nr:alanine--glyoxylate aminotransferase family protein [Geosporobacter ferrireducens]AOT71656.1 serine-pyruvate aminotransferase/archaeal aspartate aminotransferase [Geosporobacter ferrireducens]MTI55424.1 alanine--glyoxylate aminotransferase family protein [Geosporobacter ferrireducens]